MSKEQKVGIFFIGGLAILVVALSLTGAGNMFKDGYAVHVDFEDVHGLTTGSEVRVAGIKAGTVTALSYAEGRVRVTCTIDAEIPLKEDSQAYLDYQALSGNRFIAISLGSPTAATLPDGAVLSGAEIGGFTGAFGELERVGASIRRVAESFNRNQEELMQGLIAIVDDNRRTLESSLVSLDIIASRIANGEGTLGRLSTDDSLYTEMTSAFAGLRAVTAHLEVITERIASGEGSLGRMVSDDAFYDEARETMAGLRASAASVDEVATQVRSGQGTLGKLLTDDTLYHETADAVRALGRTAESIEDQAPISIMGTAVGTLF